MHVYDLIQLCVFATSRAVCVHRELKLKLVEVQAERDQANARIDRYKVHTVYYEHLPKQPTVIFLQRATERKKAQEDKEQPSTAAGRHNSQFLIHKQLLKYCL